MKLFVNGEPAEFEPIDATVRRTSDRLLVSTAKGTRSALAVRQGDAVLISYGGMQYTIERTRTQRSTGSTLGTGELRAPMPGLIVEVFVREGARVTKGTKLVVLEAMKTQQSFLAPFDGIVERLEVKRDQQVAEGAVMALIKAEERQ